METTNSDATGVPASNNERVPEWMKPFGIKEKDWLSLTKEQLRTQMRPGHPLKVQIWACGMLHSAGYKDQFAWTMRNNRRIPLTPGDIARELHQVAVKYYQSAGIKDPEFLSKLKHTKEHIRAELQELEEMGLMERRANGIPFGKLTTEQKRKLAPGSIEMYFWLKPKPDAPNRVEKQRQNCQNQVNPGEVALGALPLSAIPQILRGFGFNQLQISEIRHTENHTLIIAEAMEACKEKFFEVVLHKLPHVATLLPPEVAPTAGVLEIEVEKEVLKRGEGWLAGNSSTVTAPLLEQASQPAPPRLEPHQELTQALVDRMYPPASSVMERILNTLKDAPVAEYIAFLDERRSRGAVGRGLLPAIAEEFMQARQVAQSVTPHPIPPSRAMNTIERAKELLKQRLEAKEKKYA